MAFIIFFVSFDPVTVKKVKHGFQSRINLQNGFYSRNKVKTLVLNLFQIMEASIGKNIEAAEVKLSSASEEKASRQQVCTVEGTRRINSNPSGYPPTGMVFVFVY